MQPGQDPLTERMLEHRMVALSGTLDHEAADLVTATLALLDGFADEPVVLRLSGVTAHLDAALTVVDTLDHLHTPVHATCQGTLSAAAIAILAVADRRAAAPHSILYLCDPPPTCDDTDIDLDAHARHHRRQLRRLQERLAAACRRPVHDVAADMRDGQLLTAEQARGYGLVDICGAATRRGADVG